MGIKQPKTNRIRIGLGDRRYDRLLEYCAEKDKSITAVIEDWIDAIPEAQLGKKYNFEKGIEWNFLNANRGIA